MPLRLRIASLAIGIAAGGALGALIVSIGGLVFPLVALIALLFVPFLLIRFGLPYLIRRQLLQQLDPASGPPADAQPVANDLPRRLDESLMARDWDAFRSLLADDFVLVDPKGRRYNTRMYVKTAKWMARAYPDLRQSTDEVLADPDEPSVLWFRATTAGRPRLGPAMDVTSWTRMTLTPDGQLIRELANGGVIRVA